MNENVAPASATAGALICRWLAAAAPLTAITPLVPVIARDLPEARQDLLREELDGLLRLRVRQEAGPADHDEMVEAADLLDYAPGLGRSSNR